MLKGVKLDSNPTIKVSNICMEPKFLFNCRNINKNFVINNIYDHGYSINKNENNDNIYEIQVEKTLFGKLRHKFN